MASAHAHLTALQNHGGCDTVTIDLGRPCHFLVWGTVTAIEPAPIKIAALPPPAGHPNTAPHSASDGAVVLDIHTDDHSLHLTQLFGGPYRTPQPPCKEVFHSARRGYGRHITFLLRSLPAANVDAYAVGLIVALGDERQI